MKRSQSFKQKKYFDEVIRLHYEEGYNSVSISKIIPVGHSTVSRWIAIFASEYGVRRIGMRKRKSLKAGKRPREDQEATSLRAENARLRRQLEMAEIKSEVLDELINVAEAKFNIPIRKKAGAKQ
jgi:transposase